MSEGPFESIESAHKYVHLLVSQLEEVRGSLASDFQAVVEDGGARSFDALHLVDYKLQQLHRHLVTSARILNDLRALRRLLLRERELAREVAAEVSGKE